MQETNKRRAMARLVWTCALLAGCDADDDAEGGGDTAADTADASGSTDATTAATGGSGEEAGSGSDGTGAAATIVGEWTETFPGGGGMQTHSITEETWTMSSELGESVHHIEEWDVTAGFLIAQSDDANEFNPGAWGKLEWQWVGDVPYYCQSVFDAMSADAAKSAGGASPDLETGCGDFPWSALEPAS